MQKNKRKNIKTQNLDKLSLNKRKKNVKMPKGRCQKHPEEGGLPSFWRGQPTLEKMGDNTFCPRIGEHDILTMNVGGG